MAGKGLEAIVTNIANRLGDIEVAIDEIYYGNPTKKNRGLKLPGMTGKVNGVLPIAQEIAKVDLCNILIYLLSNADLTKIPGKDSKIGKKVEELKEKAKKLNIDIDSGQLTNKVISPSKLSKIKESLDIITLGIDNEVVAVVPQLANAKNYIDDVRGSISPYTNLNTVPSADVQRIMGKIRGVQSTMQSITSISNVQDLTDFVSRAANININNQLRELQKIINPSQILPAFRAIAALLKSINQIALKLLNFIRILQSIVTQAQALIRVLEIIIKILKLIPLPNMFTVVALTQKFSDILRKVSEFLENMKKRLAQISKLIEQIYTTAIDITAKIGELNIIVQNIISNLEICAPTKDSPITKELKDTKELLTGTVDKLKSFTTTYASALNDRNKQIFNGYTLEILEEELVDEGIKYKRRKAIALDSRGVLVAETQLTFATDTLLLFEELKLLLRDRGLALGSSEAVPGLELSDKALFESIGLIDEAALTQTTSQANAEVSSFITGIKKGGRKFKRRIRQITSQFATDSAEQLKGNAQSGRFTGARSTALPVQSR